MECPSEKNMGEDGRRLLWILLRSVARRGILQRRRSKLLRFSVSLSLLVAGRGWGRIKTHDLKPKPIEVSGGVSVTFNGH